MLSFFAFIVAMFITMVLIPPLMKSAERYAFVDMPEERKIHQRPVPRIGGVAMVAGAVTPILLWAEPNREVLAMLYGIGVILVFGVWDDRAGLDYRIKFIGQLIAVGLAVFYGGVVIRYVPFHSYEPIPDVYAIPLSLFALLGITNAINLSDGLDGLAGGTTLLSVGMLALLAYFAGDSGLFVLSMALMGGIVGFLRYNTHPAQIFMGDGGSQFLGFATGVMVILLTQKSSTVLSPAMPLLLLGLPLIDTFLVMGQRLYEGRSPFKPDKNHVHHKLLGIGFDHYESVVIIYSLQAILVTLAYVLRYRSDLVVFSTFVVALLGLALFFRAAGAMGWRAHKYNGASSVTPLSQFAGHLKRTGILGSAPMIASAATIPIYACWVILSTPAFPSDAPVTVYVLFAASVVVALALRNRAAYILLERLLLYVAITTIVYYWCSTQDQYSIWSDIEKAYFGLLGLTLLFAYRFTRNRSFRVTPTDFLIILIAVIVPTLSKSMVPQNNLGEIAIKVLILFYAAELVIAQANTRMWMLRTGLCLLLGVLALRVGALI